MVQYKMFRTNMKTWKQPKLYMIVKKIRRMLKKICIFHLYGIITEESEEFNS